MEGWEVNIAVNFNNYCTPYYKRNVLLCTVNYVVMLVTQIMF